MAVFRKLNRVFIVPKTTSKTGGDLNTSFCEIVHEDKSQDVGYVNRNKAEITQGEYFVFDAKSDSSSNIAEGVSRQSLKESLAAAEAAGFFD